MPRQAVSHTRSRRRRRLYVENIDRTCGRCRTPIPAGTEHHRDVSGTAHHPSCERLRVSPAVSAPRMAHVIQIAHQPRPCEGCGDDTNGERTVHVDGRPWHHDCRQRETRPP